MENNMAKDFGTNLFSNGQPDVDIQEADEQIFGNGLQAKSSYVRARQIDLMTIRPDLAQPRRAIPLSVRGGWNGDPREIETLLRLWRMRAESEFSFDVQGMITESSSTASSDEGEQTIVVVPDDLSPLTKGFIELVQLAADIRRSGLTNPITVAADEGGSYTIIAGERRYLAHHLLKEWTGEPDTIPCFVKDNRDVWVQASENANRAPLNAIGMARQVALLIMAMYEEQRDEVFVSYQEAIEGEGSDRAFYAQVADGRQYRVLEGYAEKLTTATGLTSYTRVRQYRNLLTIPDDLWVQADNEDWTEGRIRHAVNPPSPSQSVTNVTLSNVQSFEQGEKEMPDRAPMRENPYIAEDGRDEEPRVIHTGMTGDYSPASPVEDKMVEGMPDLLLTAEQHRLVAALWEYIRANERDDDEVYEGDRLRWRWDSDLLRAAVVFLRGVDEESLPMRQEAEIFKRKCTIHVRELSFALQEIHSGLLEIESHLHQLTDEHVEGARK